MPSLIVVPPETRLAQARASNPEFSAWVSANAGSGKTFVLARRVIRLLLQGVQPAKILCLTFTKAAAAEMSNRIFETLGEWVAMDDAKLSETLAELLERAPNRVETERARTLFALSLDTPGGLKIQTIHAFCEALLHQFPLEANVSGHFTVVDDLQQEALLAEARRTVLLQIEGAVEADSAGVRVLREAFDELLELAGDAAIEKGMREIVARREAFSSWVAGDLAAAMAPLWADAGIAPDACEADVLNAALAVTQMDPAGLAQAAALARATGGVQNESLAGKIDYFLSAVSPEERFRTRNEIFLTTEGKPRKALLTKKAAEADPALAQALAAETELALAGCRLRDAWRVLRASRALFTMADAMLEHYGAMKRRRGLADFDDLISAARALLMRSDVQRWVQYKLDRGIDHVLIDEAQDTSPRQWDIVNAIVGDFFAGEGGGARTRTVFAVGDEKQSIYSFQGADPRRFSLEAAAFAGRAGRAGKRFERVSLHLSFRSAPDVLEAVDTVFAIAENFEGLSASETATVHETVRRQDPGEVRTWPLLGKERAEDRENWLDPLDAVAPEHPAELLAERIASTIRQWIDRSEKLPGRERPIRCGDILILVRRRDVFSTAVIRRLKEKGLHIAGADRLRLTEHIAIEDLMALGRVMLMPEDDLSLAAVLKSPLFGLDDDDLTALAAGRGDQPLIEHLELLAGDREGPAAARAAKAVARIGRLRRLAMRVRPYEFYAAVLGGEGGRKAFLSRLGTEASDVLDAFELAAIGHERTGLGGLEDFIATLARSSPEVKREIDLREDEIRVITVHSAKGLEAPIVFLVDPCTPGFIASHRPGLLELSPGEDDNSFVWAPFARDALEPVRKRDAEIAAEAEAEYRRLLYVGMTRAADRLIVCGWHGVNKPSKPHWHAMVRNALRDGCRIVTEPDGFEWEQWLSPRAETAAARRERPLKASPAPAGGKVEAPVWLFALAPRESRLPRPLSPSGAADYLPRPEPETVAPPADAERLAAALEERRLALDRGTFVHRLLELLPGVERDARQGLAAALAARACADWPSGEAEAAIAEAIRLVDMPQMTGLFGPQSRAEANVAGHVRIGGRDVLVSGQIDRIAVTDEAVLIADFKTNREPPGDGEAAPPAYVLQLALYRELLRQIYRDRPVRCMLVWTRTARIGQVTDDAMDAALAAMELEQAGAID